MGLTGRKRAREAGLKTKDKSKKTKVGPSVKNLPGGQPRRQKTKGER